MLELERTFLAKALPIDLDKNAVREIQDSYIPVSAEHPKMRLRKKGEHFNLTKKIQMEAGDSSVQEEQTINLSAEEFAALSALPGRKLRKLRYEYPCGDDTAEIDVFLDELNGLVSVDFEFDSPEEKESFVMPDWCLEEVTQEEFMAGGMLCGKRYADIEPDLARFGYRKIGV
jgi:CYTH domain-containing protein